MPDRQIGISISHEQGLSIAAIYLDGFVGIDLVLIEPQIDWQAVAELYLGTQISTEISKVLVKQQAEFFSLHWANFEAKLKCCQLALTEWSPELEHVLKNCSVHKLDLPQIYAGVLALRIC